MRNVKPLITELLSLHRQLASLENQKQALFHSVSGLNHEYRAKKYGYLKYKEKLDYLLAGKTREELIELYASSKLSILKRIEHLVSNALFSIYQTQKYKELKPQLKAALFSPVKPQVSKIIKPASIKQPISIKPAVQPFEEEMAAMPERVMAEKEITQAARISFSPGAVVLDLLSGLKNAVLRLKPKARPATKPDAKPMQPSVTAKPVSAPSSPLKSIARIPAWLKFQLIDEPRKFFSERAGRGRVIEQPKLMLPVQKEVPLKPAGEGIKLFARLPVLRFFERKPKLLAPEKETPFLRMPKSSPAPVTERPGQPLQGGKQTFISWDLGSAILKKLEQRFSKAPEPVIAKQTQIPTHVSKLRQMQQRLYEVERERAYARPTLLAEQARRVRKLLEAEAAGGYKASIIGQLANFTVKKYSLRLINAFPELFGRLYNNLRAANVKILSNTYVNIMLLVSAGLAVSVSIISLFALFILNFELYKVISYPIFYGLLAGSLSVLFFLFYPSVRIKSRSRDITTNLPFALNHLASVAASGVAPSKMFDLIAESEDYGEVSIEVKKISDYVNLFGYDLLTAIKAVAVTTPSQSFKEFLQGFVSTVETGGDLNSYLEQKSEEAALRYQLERQKYNEAVSTYSDIYTGLLIAAPLFFIAALALVNLLGGSIGGLGVDIIMALGAYLIIPLLNVLFIFFLQANQPEV